MALVGMTRKQAATLRFIKGHFAEHGVPPTFAEIADHLGLRSKSGIHRILCGLAERGAIARMPNRARGISLPEDPDMELLSALEPEAARLVIERSAKTGRKVSDIVSEAVIAVLGSH